MTDHLVLGSRGQLGSELVKQLELRGESVVGLDREDCDVSSTASVRAAFAEHQPRYVFNAAAFSDIDQAESVRSTAFRVNAIGAGIVAAASREARAVHCYFSTSLVFGDGFVSPIDEGRRPAPLNNYGETKLAGERLVARNCPRSFVLRCPAMYSRFGTNIVNHLTKLALAGKKSIAMVSDEIISPTPAFLVAQTAIELAQSETVFGTYHASTKGQCSWHEFVSTFCSKLELDTEVTPVTAERWGAAARRPRYAVLKNEMLHTLGRDHFPDWEKALDAFLDANGEQIVWAMS